MMKVPQFVAFSLCSVSLTWGQAVVEKLPNEMAKKTISLNPEFLVYGKDKVKKGKKLPLLIFLHGGGATGNDIRRIERGPLHFLKTIEKAQERCLCVAPQAAKSPREYGAKGGWVPSDLDLLLEHLKKSLLVDEKRIYLTGSSMGGYGTFVWAAHSPGHFAALAPMVGGLGAKGPKDITPDLNTWGKKLAKIPMKAYYGAKDRVVPADRGEMIFNVIKKAGGKRAELIILPEEGHGAGRVPYGDVDFAKWMFAQKRD
ncbi:MAG: prolyl oligopeptidase family serine peptidase [Akkermansiaceae bacterium]